MGHRVGSVEADSAEVQGVNDRWQLALAERELRARTNRHWLLNGVTMLDPRQTFIDVTVELGRDVTLFPGTILQGSTVIGDGCEIGPDTRLVDCDRRRRRSRREHGRSRAPRSAPGPWSARSPTSDRATVVAGERTGAFYTGRLRARRDLVTRRRHADATWRAEHMEKFTTKRLALYSGGTHPALAEEVAAAPRYRSSAIPNLVEFANGEIRCRGSTRASAAATCSSCRRTAATTGARSTTRSWSS